MEADDERIAALNDPLDVALKVAEIEAEVSYSTTSLAIDHRSEIYGCLLVAGKATQVGPYDLRRAPVLAGLTSVDPDRSGTEMLYCCHVMGYEQYRPTLVAKLAHSTQAPLLKSNVSYGKDLVDKKDVGVEVSSDCETEPKPHSRRISLDGSVNKLLDISEINDFVHPSVDLLPLHAQNRSVEVNVFSSG